MSPADPQTVYADFEINKGDLFRANLSLAKWRLLGGILIFAVFVALVVAFFWYLEEQLIFWELSPLFLGAPILAVGGQVLRLHATCRKFVASLPLEQRMVRYIFSSQVDGFDFSNGSSFGHVAWTDVTGIIEEQSYFLIRRSQLEIRVLPKHALHQPSDLAVLRSIFKANLGSRARLLND
jgi:hypothetical protein